jgi:hypothetical protein
LQGPGQAGSEPYLVADQALALCDAWRHGAHGGGGARAGGAWGGV